MVNVNGKINDSCILTAKVKGFGVLTAKVNGLVSLKGSLSKHVGYSEYNGKYEVTPKTEKQTLETKDKHLNDNITINSIPYVTSDNSAGGVTVTIG